MINLKKHINALSVSLFKVFCEKHNMEEEDDYDESYAWCDHCGLFCYSSWSASKRYTIRKTEVNLLTDFDY